MVTEAVTELEVTRRRPGRHRRWSHHWRSWRRRSGDDLDVGESPDGASGGGGVDDEFFAGAVEDFSCGDGELDAVVGIGSFRISEGDSASDIEVRAAFCEGA